MDGQFRSLVVNIQRFEGMIVLLEISSFIFKMQDGLACALLERPMMYWCYCF